MMSSALVFLGGGVGAVCRWQVSLWFAAKPWAAHFYWGTLSVNIVGSFLLGILVVLCKERPTTLALLGSGFCGGFTTFSTFSVEMVRLMEESRWWSMLAYGLASVCVGILGAFFGMRLARIL